MKLAYFDVFGIAVLFALGCGRTTDGTSDWDDDAALDSSVDTGVRADGCPTKYYDLIGCSAPEAGKRCVYDLCKSPTRQILVTECAKDLAPDPPSPFGWAPTNLPCPKDAAAD